MTSIGDGYGLCSSSLRVVAVRGLDAHRPFLFLLFLLCSARCCLIDHWSAKEREEWSRWRRSGMAGGWVATTGLMDSDTRLTHRDALAVPSLPVASLADPLRSHRHTHTSLHTCAQSQQGRQRDARATLHLCPFPVRASPPRRLTRAPLCPLSPSVRPPASSSSCFIRLLFLLPSVMPIPRFFLWPIPITALALVGHYSGLLPSTPQWKKNQLAHAEHEVRNQRLMHTHVRTGPLPLRCMYWLRADRDDCTCSDAMWRRRSTSVYF